MKHGPINIRFKNISVFLHFATVGKNCDFFVMTCHFLMSLNILVFFREIFGSNTGIFRDHILLCCFRMNIQPFSGRDDA